MINAGAATTNGAWAFKELGAALSNWGRWGAQDRRGTLNFITPDCITAAVRGIVNGQIIDLGIPFGTSGFLLGGGHRPNPIHLMSVMPTDFQTEDGSGFVDDFIIMPVQTATHWDGLAHCCYDRRLYNGTPISVVSAVGGAKDLGVDGLSGVAGRGVLLDIARLKGTHCLSASTPITPTDLDAAERRQSVHARPGDIVLIRTGFRNLLSGAGTSSRSRLAPPVDPRVLQLPPEPGLSLQCCGWLHERQIAAIASDNYALEVLPSEDRRAALPVHCVLIRDMGMTVGELFDLEVLARDCEADGRWEFFFAAPPLKLTNGAGSPVNPIAIK